MAKYDFEGWVTKNDVKCSDGRTIRRGAFTQSDKVVPLVWNHFSSDIENIIGKVKLQHRDEGVYGYGSFNDTERGQLAKELVKHGDITRMSIYANRLKQTNAKDVLHGMIREVSLVLAGANPEAQIMNVLAHKDDYSDDETYILCHDEFTSYEPEEQNEEELKMAEEAKIEKKEKTVADVYEAMTEEQKNVVHFLVGQALEDASADEEDDDEVAQNDDYEGEDDTMKHNLFADGETREKNVLTHADMDAIVELARTNKVVGTLQMAMDEYTDGDEDLKHSYEDATQLFPDPKDVRPGMPETLTRDYTWIDSVINGANKTPFSRIRTRNFDARELTGAKGYGTKGNKKTNMGNVKLLKRTTDPTTVYVKDELHRDDIVDITDFDAVEYLYSRMTELLKEKIAISTMIGDGLEEGDEAKVSETNIRPIWLDDELYTIRAEVDIDTAKKELQGSNTGANFGENYIYAEAIITAALYAREKYKGSGSLSFYCTPHLLNVMLLARDLNGRRIYESKSDLQAALNVSAIHTVEQFEGKKRKDNLQKEHELLGIFVNMNDYNYGSTKGGQIARFNQFDIDFNKQKALFETRLSGALTRPFAAIALEKPVAGE